MMNPKGKRFVIQQHTEGTDIHWDLMLESGDSLQTYRLDRPPQEVLQHPANAVKIFNHQLKFLTYEGQVHAGKGSVHIIESGTYQVIYQKADYIELHLNGRNLEGKFILIHIKDEDWQFASSEDSD